MLETVGDVLLPGGNSAGIAHFVDTQLGKDDPLLILKYFDWPGAYKDFYSSGLAALDKASALDLGYPYQFIAQTQGTW